MHRTMTHLCLGVSANDLQVPGGHEEALLLFRSRLVEQGGQEHAQVEIQGRRPSVRKASKEYQGRALEEISGVDRRSKGRKKPQTSVSMR